MKTAETKVTKEEQAAIPYDRMKDQIDRELMPFYEKAGTGLPAPPLISFEKGCTRITISSPPLTDVMLIDFLLLIKQHITHLRVHGFDRGYYAFQALNSNIFKTENLLDNFKVEFFGLSASSRVEISKKGT